ncbi:MAG TPA: ROK family protein [Allosphingosinicella sp.]|jgi:fructokinase
MIAAVELGGTKVLAAIARDPLKPLRQIRISTDEPSATLRAVADFFDEAREELGQPEALGIASFGPIDIRPGSPGWGRMGRTTKPGWAGADVGGYLGRRLGSPVNLDTDVNGAALAEARWGAGRGLGSIAYLTVGTGIGGGIAINGEALHGAAHPEIGHVRIRRDPGDSYSSRCPYHEDCAEGLASGPAIMERFGKTLTELEPDHPFRSILADYLGQVCATLVLIASPQRIVIGGGVMTGGALHAGVEKAMLRWLNGYVETGPADGSPFIVPPGLGDQAGLAGGFALAQDLLEGGE